MIIKDLVQSNPNISDIGAILGCLRRDVKSLEELKKGCSSIDEFIDVASQRADILLVSAAIEAAIGYDYEETEQNFKWTEMKDKDGNKRAIEVPTKTTRKKKHARKNDNLLKFILSNRLPEYFSDVKKVEINKKSIDLKGDITKEIEGFAGKLLDVIDADFVETDKN